MKEQKTYRLKLTALSPIHIGTGEDYEPTNFVINGGKLHEFDEILFYKSLSSGDRAAFDSKLGNWLSLIDFYKSKKEEARKISFFECDVSLKVEEKYLKLRNDDGSKNKNQFQINKTYKNPNTHQAVIPGSSLKGMFDTLLKIYAKPEQATNEIRQKLSIADAQFLCGDLEVGFCYRKHKDPQKAAKNAIPQMLEIIKKGSEFITTISLPFEIAELEKLAASYYQKRINTPLNNKGFILRVGKYNGKDFMVYDMKDAKNSYGKSIATHTLYEDNQPFGWMNVEPISEEQFQIYQAQICTQESSYYASLELKQKSIREKLMQQKEEAQKRIFEKEQREKEQEELFVLEKAQEEARINSLSPFELALEELTKSATEIPLTTLLLKALQDGYLEKFKTEALKYLQAQMIETGEWKETTQAKNPQKDKAYQKTLSVKKLLV